MLPLLEKVAGADILQFFNIKINDVTATEWTWFVSWIFSWFISYLMLTFPNFSYFSIITTANFGFIRSNFCQMIW